MSDANISTKTATQEAVVGGKANEYASETPEVLVDRIYVAHCDMQIAAIGFVHKAIAIGEDLLKLQSQVEEGRWVRYLGQHCPFSQSMAYNYMALAENRETVESELQRVGNGLSLRGALKLITKKRNQLDPPEPTGSNDTNSDSDGNGADHGADHGDAGEIDDGDRVDSDVEHADHPILWPDDRGPKSAKPKTLSRAERFVSGLNIIHVLLNRIAEMAVPELTAQLTAQLTARERAEARDTIAECISALETIKTEIDGHVEYLCNPAVSDFFSTAGGVAIFEWIPDDRRSEVARGFLDKLTVAGMLEVMSAEFGRQLRARLPAPKRNDAIEPAPEIAAEPNQAPVDTTLPDDGSIPPFLRRTAPTDADKAAIANLQSHEAERKRLKATSRIAKLKAKQSGALSRMPVQGKAALKLINASEAAS